MSVRFGQILLLSVAPIALSPELVAQAPGSWACRADSLAGYNCAHHYDGMVTLTAELKGAVEETWRLVATVTAGRVSCRVLDSEIGEFEGPGMLAVVHEVALAAGGEYSISVWCPEEAGDRPRRGTEPQIRIMRQRAASYATLEGKDEHEHPDTDPVNGLTGTETITWTLRRR